MRFIVGGLCALLLAMLMNGEPLKATGSCEGLASLTMPNATIRMGAASFVASRIDCTAMLMTS